MKRYEIRFRPQAEADLFDLYHYIADTAGDEAAGDYVQKIEAACMALETFPERGSRRDDVRPGLRMLSFEQRAVIAYQVEKAHVTIVRVFYRGRDYERILRE